MGSQATLRVTSSSRESWTVLRGEGNTPGSQMVVCGIEGGTLSLGAWTVTRYHEKILLIEGDG